MPSLLLLIKTIKLTNFHTETQNRWFYKYFIYFRHRKPFKKTCFNVFCQRSKPI